LRHLVHLNGLKEYVIKIVNNSGKFILWFRDTYFSVWKTGNKKSGYTKSAGFLELKTVNNAGHLVPMDQG
jgi:hypothetical protein